MGKHFFVNFMHRKNTIYLFHTTQLKKSVYLVLMYLNLSLHVLSV